jgi:hypothetical protein
MPRIVDIDTTAAGYQTRFTQYNDIMAFWKPHIIKYYKMNKSQREAWRAADPFLDRLLTVTKAINTLSEEDL